MATQIKAVKLAIGHGFGLENDDALNAKKGFAIRVSENMSYSIS